MSTRLELPDDLVEDIRLRAERDGRGLAETAAELLRTGLAVSAVNAETAIRSHAPMLEDRKQIAEKFLSGEWATELAGFESGLQADRDVAETRARAWRL